MKTETFMISRRVAIYAVVLPLLAAFVWVLSTRAAGETYMRDLERVTVSSSGEEADNSSFFSFTSENGRYVTFGSWARNFAPDHPINENYIDAFVRDRVTGETRKITIPHTGGVTDNDSSDPVITADGRYISYTSFATNLVPNDNNGDLWQREGLDVFVYDQQTGVTVRASLAENGDEVKGNSAGVITPDGQNILFFSNGTNLVANAIYKRNFHTGAMSRITKNPFDGGGGNDMMVHVWGDYDASHIVFSSYASNLVLGDYNGLLDIFLYTAEDGSTRRITMGYAGGEANGTSGQPFISMDGRFVVFRSDASNLVPGDTNGVGDVFLYNVETGQMTRASVGSGGRQANGLSRDPSVCANGRYVSFTSEADNLVPGDNNGEHDVFLHDTETGETILVSKTDGGVIGNGRSHRSFLVPDCSSIVFASDATNFVPNDTNNSRDMFMAQIATPSDFSRTVMSCGAAVSPGDVVQHSIQFVNDGTDASAASFVSPIPAGATLVANSLSGGLLYNDTVQQVEWNGVVDGSSSTTLTYRLQIDGGLVGPTAVSSTATWTADGSSHDVFCAAVVDGFLTYLPIAYR
jgi:uncharacterized repeat protein (TIGR01451 family)